MADDTSTPESDETQDEPLTPAETALIERADNPDAVRNAIKAERQKANDAEERNKKLLARLAEFEDRDKTDAERQSQLIEELQRERDEAAAKARELELNMLRARVASEAGVPAELVDRLRGDNEKDLRADAVRLAETFAVRSQPRMGGFGGGPRGGEANTEDPKLGLGMDLLGLIQKSK